MASSPHTVLIGAGIVGAALAYALAKRGGAVTVIDGGSGADRATHGSFGWINAHCTEDEAYFALRLESMRIWRDLAREIDGLPVRFGGSLNWERPDRLEETARALEAAGNPARIVSSADIREMEPALADPPDAAIDMPMEGVADPDRIAEALLDAAVACGAKVWAPVRAHGIATVGGRVKGVELPSGDLVEADRVIVAAGSGTSGLLASIGTALPMKAPEGLLVRTAPVPRLSQRIFTSDDLHAWQMADGRLILGDDYGGSEEGPDRGATEARVLALAQRMFAGVALVQDRSTVTVRPVPEDGYPAVGRVPGTDGLFVATLHSGVTLAPVIADRVARMVLEDAEAGDLQRYRPERFGLAR